MMDGKRTWYFYSIWGNLSGKRVALSDANACVNQPMPYVLSSINEVDNYILPTYGRVHGLGHGRQGRGRGFGRGRGKGRGRGIVVQ